MLKSAIINLYFQPILFKHFRNKSTFLFKKKKKITPQYNSVTVYYIGTAQKVFFCLLVLWFDGVYCLGRIQAPTTACCKYQVALKTFYTATYFPGFSWKSTSSGSQSYFRYSGGSPLPLSLLQPLFLFLCSWGEVGRKSCASPQTPNTRAHPHASQPPAAVFNPQPIPQSMSVKND